MKTIKLLQVMTLGMMLSACGDSTSDNKDAAAAEAQPQIEAQNTGMENVVEAKFLISNDAVGDFKIGGPWEDIAQNDYHYKSIQGVAKCIDASCDGGFSLGSNVLADEDGMVENPEIIIGAEFLDESESETQYESNPDVFSLYSDPLAAYKWFWKNKIAYLMVYSDAFKTKEGIGVGSTLEDLEKIMGKLVVNIGWLEEDPDALTVAMDAYPNVDFIIDIDDAIGGYDKLSDRSSNGTATISEFKAGTKIKRIIVSSKADA